MLGEIALGTAIADERFAPLLMAGAAVAAVVGLFHFPLAGAILFLIAVASVFPRDLLTLEAGGVSAAAFELLLAGLLFVALVRPRRATWGGVPGRALALFLVFLGLSAAAAVAAGAAELPDVFNAARSFGPLALFFVVVRLFPTVRDARSLIIAGAVIGGISGALALLVATGSELGAPLRGQTEEFIAEEAGLGQLARVRLPGLGLAYALLWYVVVRLVYSRGERKLAWALTLAGAFTGILLSLNRNMWIGLLLGLALMLVLGGGVARRRLAVGVAALGAALALMLYLPGDLADDSALAPIVERGSTLLEPGSVREESSLESRGEETERAVSSALRHPILGIGPGVPFGVFFYERAAEDRYIRTPQTFLHNQYLYLALVAGVPGLACFLVFLVSVLRRALRGIRSDPPTAALGVGLVMVAVSAVVAIYFSAPDMAAVVGLVAGVIVAMTSVTAQHRTGSGRPQGERDALASPAR